MARKEVPHPQLPPASTALSPDKEIELLVKSIEESSKHCRETLIALLGASSLTSLLKALPKSMPSETRSRTAEFIEWLMPNSLFRTIVLYFIRGK